MPVPEVLINSYIVETDNAEREKHGSELARCPLLQVIKSLEDPLTQEDGLIRAMATQCLADVIKEKSSLSLQEIKVLAVFLSDRLHDQESTKCAAEGLLALTEKPNYKSAKTTSPEFLAKLKDVNMLNCSIETRLAVFSLLLKIVTEEKPPVEFVSTFTSLASGEKDPRNLMLSLSISKAILKNMGATLSPVSRAEIYDVTFCYFPVKFHPPKDMPYKITGDEIKQKLRSTLANPTIAEWVIPGLISKLTAVNIVVKLDSLAALDELIANVQSEGNLSRYWEPVWEGIKFEVLHGTPENETYGPVLQILSRLTTIPEFLDKVAAEFNSTAKVPDSKLSQLCYLVIGISSDSQTVWDKLAPAAIEKCYDHPNLLVLFLNTKYGIPHLDQIFQCLLQAHANGNKKDSIMGLKKVALTKNGQEYVPLIVQILTSDKEYDSLAELATKHAVAIQEHCIPVLLSELPSETALDALGKICCVRPLVHTLTVRLLSRIDLTDHYLSIQLLNTLIESSAQLKTSHDLTGYSRILTAALLGKFSEACEKSSDALIEAACILLERAGRGVVGEDQQSTQKHLVLEYLDKVHPHLIISSLAAMESFPFRSGYIYDTVLPRLESSSELLERVAYLRLLALAANKWPNDKSAFPHTLESLNKDVRGKLTTSDAAPNTLEEFAWVTKGLLLRADMLGLYNAEMLNERSSKCKLVAKVYGAIIAPDRLLCKENGCVVRPLFRQRLFIISLPILSGPDSSALSLLAMSSLLKYTPRSVVMSQFDKILPLLLSSLSTNAELLQVTAITTLSSALPEASDALATKLDTLVPVLIKIATSARSAEARVAALKCLIALKEALPAETASYREQLIDELTSSLGDSNREVRKYAVKCRQIQF